MARFGTRACLMVGVRLVSSMLMQTADTRTRGHANAFTVGVGAPDGAAHGLKAGGETVLNEQVELACFLDRQVFLTLKPFYRARVE